MNLWNAWFNCVKELQPACKRNRTFFWMLVFLMAVSIRCNDLAGVTSIVRILGLTPLCYDRLLDFLHSPALQLEQLYKLWIRWVLQHFVNKLMVNGYIVLITDGIKIAKEGKKMPGVKFVHQNSNSNSKAEFIMGHSCHAIGLLVSALDSFFCVPLVCQIYEGVVFSNKDKRTLYDKLLALLQDLDISTNYYLIGDAYYAVRKMIVGLKQNNQHLITRAKNNAKAYEPAPKSATIKRGRPKKYGAQLKLKKLMQDNTLFQEAESPISGERKISIRFYAKQLYWRASGELVQFVLVKHPNRGNIILISTDLNLAPLKIIELYGLRFKIEVSFKQALYTVGAFSYHFWLKAMKPRKRGDGNQYLHRESEEYRLAVKKKIAAYHRFMQLSFIAQGVLQYISIQMSEQVWKSFGSWIRTIRPGICPSEMVTATALKNSLPEFIADCKNGTNFKKFLHKRIDISRTEGMRLAA